MSFCGRWGQVSWTKPLTQAKRKATPTARSATLCRLTLSSAASPKSSVSVSGASAQARKVSLLEPVQIRASTVQQGSFSPHSVNVSATRDQSRRPACAAW